MKNLVFPKRFADTNCLLLFSSLGFSAGDYSSEFLLDGGDYFYDGHAFNGVAVCAGSHAGSVLSAGTKPQHDLSICLFVKCV